ncbi:UNKNOWN [Stylonychia lemnae]|uniref:Uncharacterized protein n=1 Tax=Stylonychia lemnae TaxID=5949 RepID=A0A078AU76_STYLE|nr:UNKNOWN [Stylonychia lemnae]|eukprot:CDW85541.1 UNKNOWN [Stylonychia lemnae]
MQSIQNESNSQEGGVVEQINFRGPLCKCFKLFQIIKGLLLPSRQQSESQANTSSQIRWQFARDLLEEDSLPLLEFGDHPSLLILDKECYFSGICKQIFTDLKANLIVPNSISGILALKKLIIVHKDFEESQANNFKNDRLKTDIFVKMVKTFPSIKTLKQDLKQNKENPDKFLKQDWLLIKLILDFYETYYIFKNPTNFDMIQKRVLPLKLQIFKNLSDSDYDQIFKLQNTIKNDNCLMQDQDQNKIIAKEQYLREIEDKIMNYSKNNFKHNQFIL